MTFKPYPKYKASGVEWLGDVPCDWSLVKTSRHFKIAMGQTILKENLVDEGGWPVFSATDGDHYFGRIDSPQVRLVRGDLVIPARGNSIGAVKLVQEPSTTTQTTIYCKHLQLSTVDSRYIHYFMRGFRRYLFPFTQTAIPQITVEEVSKNPLLLPPIEIQKSIATFLDDETAKMDTLIAKQEAMIALFKEKRQAMITHAVTKGLDPNVPMKASAVEWLGDVPEHWIVMSLTRVTTSKCDGPFGSGLKSDHYTDSGARVVRLQNIKAAHFHGDDAAYIDLKYFENDLARHDVQEGDLLIAGLGDDKNLVGRACVAPPGIAPALVKADCFRFRLNLDLAVPSYIAFQLCCSASVDAGTLATGSTRSRIPLSTMASRVVALPPQEEQTKIVAYIEAQSERFFVLIAKAQQAIALQKEHRTALISAAVTGKIDVRNEVAERKAA